MGMRDVRRSAVLPAVVVVLSSLAMVGTAAAVPPGNDAFANAIVLAPGGGTITGATNVDATMEAGEPTTTVASATTSASVWYRWTAPADGMFVAETFGSDFDTVIGIYTGTSVGALTELDGS